MAKEYTGEAEWSHAAHPIWVVFYPDTYVRRAHYHAYRAVAPVPAGRKPSSVDNRRITPDLGVESLEAAIAACEAFVASPHPATNDTEGEMRDGEAAKEDVASS